ncbi:MAG TPA: Maf family protein [Candidatus Binataceae bacterium]|nr:Maf family protein [Candidatus Binataceae bacterium]
MTNRPRLLLASTSPRRRQLLEAAGIDFALAASGLDEVRRVGEGAEQFALRMAGEKALAVSRDVDAGALVLAADTVVECAGEILEKPRDADDARRMLRTLSGRVHTVVTAFALARDGALVESRAVTSRVRFRVLGEDEIDSYVRSGEPMDKAGAYGIQGAGGGFIAEVEGARDNVMGLPMDAVLAALARHGITSRRSRAGA